VIDAILGDFDSRRTPLCRSNQRSLGAEVLRHLKDIDSAAEFVATRKFVVVCLMLLLFPLQQTYLDEKAKAQAEADAKLEDDGDSARDDGADEEVEEEEAEEEEEDLTAEYEELLETIRESKEQNNGRIEDQHVIKFFRDKLHSKPCQNQGFILDGFPKAYEQAKELFAGLTYLNLTA
jgi:hypothetical protein